MMIADIKQGKILHSPICSESGEVANVIFTAIQPASVESSFRVVPFNGDLQYFWLSVKAIMHDEESKRIAAPKRILQRPATFESKDNPTLCHT